MKTLSKTNLSQKYINDIKLLFPVIRKTEKTYLQQMKQNIDDYCEQSTVSSMEELYEEFGKPQEVVYNYYSMMDMMPLFSYIRLRRILKLFLIFVCAIIFAITLFSSVILYQEHLSTLRQEAIFIETNVFN